MYIDLDRMEMITRCMMDALEHLDGFRKNVRLILADRSVSEDEKNAVCMILARQVFSVFEESSQNEHN